MQIYLFSKWKHLKSVNSYEKIHYGNSDELKLYIMDEEDLETIEVSNNEFLRQFEATIKNELVVIEYAEQERKIFLTKLRMSDALKETGYLDKFIKAVLDIVEKTNARVMPTSPDIVKFFRRNRKYKSLLPVGINI